MPVYNGEQHIGRAIESLLAQSFADFTIFVSDNASTDRTGEIVKEYQARDSRITYYRQPENIGMTNNFKFVLDAAGAEYFMWAAHDDIRGSDFMEICMSALEADTALGLATTAATIVDSLDRVMTEEHEVERFNNKSLTAQVFLYTLLAEGLGKVNIIYGIWRTAAARVTWDAYPQRYVWGHDNHFTLALVSRYRVRIDPNPLFRKTPTLHRGEQPQPLASEVRTLSYRDRNNPFPFMHFRKYFNGHMEALEGTPYRPLVAMLLYLRLPHVFFVYMRERNYKKFFRKLIKLQ